MKRLLVIGASGLLGNKILHVSKDNYDVYGTYVNNIFQNKSCQIVKLDITDAQSTTSLIEKISPDWIILSSAMTHVDLCEDEPKNAWKLNVDGPRNVALAAEKAGAKIMYVSTDYVFDGEKGRYNEEDTPNPINEYGRTKLEGENVIRKICKNSVISRVAVLYGWNPITGKQNFVNWVIDRLKNGKEVSLFKDQYVCPTFNANAAEVFIKMLENDLTGLYNVCGSDCVNRYEAGIKIAKTFDFDANLLLPTKLEQYEGSAKRPRNSCLNIGKLEKRLNIKMMNLDEGLINMRREIE